MSTKNKILIAIGIIIFILVDTTLKISSAIGIVAYLILRKQILEKHPKDFVDGIKFLLIVPIIQLLLLFFIYSAGNGCINVAGRIDNLHNVSTYTPYLGDLGEIVDFANQNGALPEIERSTSVISLIDSANTINLISIVSCILTIILIFIELYGVYRIGKLTKRQMRISNIAIALIFLVFSIFLGRFLDMYVNLLSKIYPIPDRIPIIVIIPIITILIVSLAYRFYSKALDFLFASTENQTSETKESPKTSDENQAIPQSSTPHENQASAHPKKRSIVPYIVLGIGCIIFITIMIISFNKKSDNDDREQPTANIENPDGSNSNYAQESEFKEENEYYNEDTITEEKPEVEFIEENDNYTYNIYENARYKFRIKYPSFFSDVSESGSGDGCTFKKDDKTYLIAYGSFKDFNEPLEDQYNKYKAKSPAYCQLKDNWLVVSDYTDDGCIYYLKTVLKDDIFVSAYIQYPIDEKDFYSTIISEIFPVFPN